MDSISGLLKLNVATFDRCSQELILVRRTGAMYTNKHAFAN